MSAVIAFTLAQVFFSCQLNDAISESEKDNISNEVHETLRNYHLDVENEGLLAEFKYLDSSVDFFWLPPGYTSPLTFDSVATTLKESASNWKTIRNSFDTLVVVPFNACRAIYAGRLRSTMTDTSGKTSTFILLEAGQMINREGSWKLLNGETKMLE